MKLWGGRFSERTDSLVSQFNASLPFDIRLYEEDIKASMAWANGLVGAGVLKKNEASAIVSGLEQVRGEIKDGTIAIEPEDEDIHTLVERRLTQIVGPVAGKLHTGRSRNDQVVTDFRLWVMRAIDHLQGELADLKQALVTSARSNLNLPLPGYTHLQHAQPVTWGHWALSHFWPLTRDSHRLTLAREEAAVLPLGSAALAGTPFPVDRQSLAVELGFATISQNSLDAVSDRDFATDFLYAMTVVVIHLSRLSEQLIIFNSAEFGFIELDDAFSTGSSLMPQKKNPDTLELTRGKAGRLIGNLTGLLATLKGLPSAYDKDLQEDKEPLFDAFDTLSLVCPVMSGLLKSLQIKPEKMAAQLEPALFATDLADYLVRKGLPFRQAHETAGLAVRSAEQQGIPLSGITLDELRQLSEMFEHDALALFDVRRSLASRTMTGGTAPEALASQLAAAEKLINL